MTSVNSNQFATNPVLEIAKLYNTVIDSWISKDYDNPTLSSVLLDSPNRFAKAQNYNYKKKVKAYSHSEWNNIIHTNRERNTCWVHNVLQYEVVQCTFGWSTMHNKLKSRQPKGWYTPNQHQQTSGNKSWLCLGKKSCAWTHCKNYSWQPISIYILCLCER